MCVVFPFSLFAQQQSTYNKKGDDAMKRQDYIDAKMWYEEGVSQCDPYSIKQLTTIWLKNERMRPSMRSLMNKCLNCLNVRATENDTTAVSQLITYYKEGIGAPKSDELATYWTEKLETLSKPAESPEMPLQPATAYRERMKFFIGYSFSPTAPYGVTIGGVGQRLGWYIRFKTNMSFQSYEEGKTISDFTDNASYEYLEKKANTYATTAGIVIRTLPWLYTSIGFGYGNHDLLYKYRTVDYDDSNKTSDIWCKQNDDSFKGVAADIDFMAQMGSFFISVGCNTVNFKYIDLNAGVGLFF